MIPKEISKIPEITPYRIDWPIELDLCNDLKVSLNNYYHDIALLNSTIKLAENNDKSAIYFIIETDEFMEKMKLTVNKNGYHFEHSEGELLNIRIKKKEYSLVEFFEENPQE